MINNNFIRWVISKQQRIKEIPSSEEDTIEQLNNNLIIKRISYPTSIKAYNIPPLQNLGQNINQLIMQVMLKMSILSSQKGDAIKKM